jgi:plasmid maintenance system killer protein
MEVRFKTKQLEELYLDSRRAQRELGEVARKYVQRVNFLRAADRFTDIRALPALRCHQLKGARSGEWAIDLNRFYRLIVTVTDDIPEVVRIEEISKHYGD